MKKLQSPHVFCALLICIFFPLTANAIIFFSDASSPSTIGVTDSNGNLIRTFTAPVGSGEIRGLATDGTNLFAADVTNQEIIKFDPFGNFLDSFDNPFIPQAAGLGAVNGELWMGDGILGGYTDIFRMAFNGAPISPIFTLTIPSTDVGALSQATSNTVWVSSRTGNYFHVMNTSGSHQATVTLDFISGGISGMAHENGIAFVAPGGAPPGSLAPASTPEIYMLDSGGGLLGSFSAPFSSIGGMTSIATVPVPAAAWLFGSGLLGLVGVARRKKA